LRDEEVSNTYDLEIKFKEIMRVLKCHGS